MDPAAGGVDCPSIACCDQRPETSDQNASSTTGVVPTRYSNDAQTIVKAVEKGRDDIVLIYDGDKFCNVEVGDPSQFGGIPDDAMIVIDSDLDSSPPKNGQWDASDISTNWQKTGGNFVSNNNPNGTYFIEIKRVSSPNIGLRLRVTFRVTLVTSGGGVNMTVDNVQLVEI